jgi:hypothetical protein
MTVMRQLTMKMARAMKRARVDRARAIAKETRVMATMVAAMMANCTKDSVRSHNNQLRGSDDDNSKGNEDDEGVKGDGDGRYGKDVLVLWAGSGGKMAQLAASALQWPGWQ